ncbi:membrane-bound serine racemase VanT [Enterococcus larvae]|uniref:membrane-bound serine racemase VanT n=1 Tax=Enterococcus larvae TaxID=2794352 RepID=UPI003F2C9B19
MTRMLKQKKMTSCPHIQRATGVDQFRLAAAVMVIAIHTFPFASFNGFLDQVITLSIFRVAVPFFFMVTGYYLIGPYAEKPSYPKSWKINRFLLSMLKLYLLICILYLPVSIYTGTVSFSMPLMELAKVIIFDGVLYHLWYFPAVILGVVICRFLLQKAPISLVLLGTSVLYLIGLGGDSYYYFIELFPGIKVIYQLFFQLFDYTRNGLFFSPLFLILGAKLYLKRGQQTKLLHAKMGFAFLGLALEGTLLHAYTMMRHDSLYFTLPFVSYYLFQFLLKWQPKYRFFKAKEYSLWLYILHPFSIMGLYFLAKLLPFLENSLLQFLLTVLFTLVLSVIPIEVLPRFKRKKRQKIRRAGKEIDLAALRGNYHSIKELLPEKTKLMAVVKADAYGHGAEACSRQLEREGVSFFAVAVLEEAIRLRKCGIQGEILILGYTSPEDSDQVAHYELIQSVFSREYAEALNRRKVRLRCHLKIDTGMHRLGFTPDIQEILPVYHMAYLDCEGIYSHLGSSDTLGAEGRGRTEQQIIVFDELLGRLEEANINYGCTHLQSSYGVVNYPELSYDYARVGIFLYGVLSQPDKVLETKLRIRPVLSVKAVLVSQRTVQAGEYIGYGTANKTDRNRKIGTVAIGYADGIPRQLSNTGYSLRYKDFSLPQIGMICMDMLLVDLTDVPEITLGAEIEIMENCEDVAAKGATITNELLSRLGGRLENKTSC